MMSYYELYLISEWQPSEFIFIVFFFLQVSMIVHSKVGPFQLFVGNLFLHCGYTPTPNPALPPCVALDTSSWSPDDGRYIPDRAILSHDPTLPSATSSSKQLQRKPCPTWWWRKWRPRGSFFWKMEAIFASFLYRFNMFRNIFWKANLGDPMGQARTSKNPSLSHFPPSHFHQYMLISIENGATKQKHDQIWARLSHSRSIRGWGFAINI
jgi:hypothetical protein